MAGLLHKLLPMLHLHRLLVTRIFFLSFLRHYICKTIYKPNSQKIIPLRLWNYVVQPIIK